MKTAQGVSRNIILLQLPVAKLPRRKEASIITQPGAIYFLSYVLNVSALPLALLYIYDIFFTS